MKHQNAVLYSVLTVSRMLMEKRTHNYATRPTSFLQGRLSTFLDVAQAKDSREESDSLLPSKLLKHQPGKAAGALLGPVPETAGDVSMERLLRPCSELSKLYESSSIAAQAYSGKACL